MGYRGAVRSFGAAMRKMDREMKRQQRIQEKQQRDYQRMQEFERVTHEVQDYNEFMNSLVNIHKNCTDKIDWESIRYLRPPEKPARSYHYEHQATLALNNYKPGFFEKLFGTDAKRRYQLQNEVCIAKQRDQDTYNHFLKTYKANMKKYKNDKKLAKKICKGDLESYFKALSIYNSFSEISLLGEDINFSFVDPKLIVAQLKSHSKDIVPPEVKTQLKSGKLSVKKMPITRFWECYFNHICSSNLRIARELFALLPIEMVLINTNSDLLNEQTGHLDETPILSVLIPRDTLDNLNFEHIVPLESLKNFVHNINFKKTKGFYGTSVLDYERFLEE